MNKRKIENWLLFSLKLMPILFLVLFGVYLHRHELDPINESSTEFIPFEVGDSFATGYEISLNNLSNVDDYSLVYEFANSFEDPVVGFTLFYNAENKKFIISEDLLDNAVYMGDTIKLGCGLDENGNVVPLNPEQTEWYLYEIRETLGSSVINKIESSSITVNNPIEIISYHFNEYLNDFYTIDIFNINSFYDWTVNTWFNSNAPLIYNIVFRILIYELIVDLIYLLYSFITFIIKFAQKWLNGIYNKDW